MYRVRKIVYMELMDNILQGVIRWSETLIYL